MQNGAGNGTGGIHYGENQVKAAITLLILTFHFFVVLISDNKLYLALVCTADDHVYDATNEICCQWQTRTLIIS